MQEKIEYWILQKIIGPQKFVQKQHQKINRWDGERNTLLLSSKLPTSTIFPELNWEGHNDMSKAPEISHNSRSKEIF